MEYIASRQLDLVALQEVTPNTAPLLSRRLATAGFLHVRDSLGSVPPGAPRRRSLGVLLASRFPFEPSVNGIASPWPEKALSQRVTAGSATLDLHTVHAPPGRSNGWSKIEVLEAVFAALARPTTVPQILTGDFNAPQLELDDGTLVTWAQRIRPDGSIATAKQFRGGPGDRWDAGERNVLQGLRPSGIQDVFRTLHGYERHAVSWVLSNRRGTFPRRFDHILASESLGFESAQYLSEPVQARLSDHRPLEVTLAP